MSKDDNVRLDDDETEAEDRLEDLTLGKKKLSSKPAATETEEDSEPAAEPEQAAEAEKEEVEEPANPESEWRVDPLKKRIYDRDVKREAKRMKDEFAGKEFGWVRKEIKQKYRGKQQEFESVLAKGEKYDALEARLQQLEAKVSGPAKDAEPSGNKAKPKPDYKAIAQKIVADKNLRDENADVIEAILSARMDINDGQGPLESDEEFAARMERVEWAKAARWAESQEDYRSDFNLQALAEARSRKLGERPDVALQNARKELAGKPVKKAIGVQKGKPALAKDNSAGKSDTIEWDGKEDPLDALRRKRTT
jgi:BMFP domain-containing protein YqiC